MDLLEKQLKEFQNESESVLDEFMADARLFKNITIEKKSTDAERYALFYKYTFMNLWTWGILNHFAKTSVKIK